MTDRAAAYEAWRAGMKPKEIADKFGVSVNTVKSWLTRSKKDEDTKSGAPAKVQRVHPDRKKGAPPKNQNAVGNPGGGAPAGNTNRLTHGAYCKVFDDLFTEQEKELWSGMDTRRVSLLKDEIRMFTLRERWLLRQINKYEAVPSGLAVQNIVKEGKKSTTTVVSTFAYITPLNNELTKVQRAKALNIRMLFEFVEEEDSGEGREDALEFIGALDGNPGEWEDDDETPETEAGADEV